MTLTGRPRPASVAIGGAPSAPGHTSKRSIKNPFRRQDRSSPTSLAAHADPPLSSIPPPAYATLPSSNRSTAPSKQRAASLFSWKSGKMSWGGFSSLRGKADLEKEAKPAHPELPSSADRLKSTWKRRQNRHGVLDFEVFHPPFVVELDDAIAPPTALDFTRTPSVIPPRSTFTPSPVPPASPRSPCTRDLPPAPVSPPRPAAGAGSASSRLPRISETQRPPLQPSSSSSTTTTLPSPELTKTAFSNQFPLPPARRPSSAELVSAKPAGPTRSLLTPPQNLPPKRYTSTGLPRPKNPPAVSSIPSRLPTPSPSLVSTRSAASPVPPSSLSSSPLTTNPARRPTSQTSIRKPISIPARPRSSPRLTALANSALSPVDVAAVGGRGGGGRGAGDGDARNSWDSTTTVTVTRSSSTSDDTVGAMSPIDLKHRTSLVVPVSKANAVVAHDARSQSERMRAGEVISDAERKRFEREVEAMFSEERMKDLLVQLGI
ncbi:hypothetical protein JCM11491_002092 [Sporobolomyces phaffii]